MYAHLGIFLNAAHNGAAKFFKVVSVAGSENKQSSLIALSVKRGNMHG